MGAPGGNLDAATYLAADATPRKIATATSAAREISSRTLPVLDVTPLHGEASHLLQHEFLPDAISGSDELRGRVSAASYQATHDGALPSSPPLMEQTASIFLIVEAPPYDPRIY